MNSSISRRALLQAGAALGAWPLLANAQSAAWPGKPVHLVVPFPPGGTTDFVTRLVGTELAKALGQPDGGNFVTVANSFCANETLLKKLPYDTTKDLRPVALMGMSEHVLATPPGSGLKTLADLRAAAKAKPGTLSYASFGNGTSAHLSGELLKQQMGIELVHVPYKGQGPALTDLLGGQVTLMFGNWPEFRSHVQAGKLVALGMATKQRSVYAPDIPTLAEQGVPVESNSWNGLLAPAATPDAIVQRMNAEVNRALASPAVVAAFQKGGIASLSGTPAQFADFIQSEIAKYAEVIRKGNITLEA